jgi:hypothetical protein
MLNGVCGCSNRANLEERESLDVSCPRSGVVGRHPSDHQDVSLDVAKPARSVPRTILVAEVGGK